MAFLSGKLNRWVRLWNNCSAARAAEARRLSFDHRIHLRTTKRSSGLRLVIASSSDATYCPIAASFRPAVETTH
jgi:hypothetical protein